MATAEEVRAEEYRASLRARAAAAKAREAALVGSTAALTALKAKTYPRIYDLSSGAAGNADAYPGLDRYPALDRFPAEV